MKNNYKFISIILVIFIGLSLVSCGKNEEANEEGIGKDIPERIVSLSPSTTEILFAIGLGDKIVGVTEFCDYPEEALDKDKVGGYAEPNMEKIIDLEPDLIVYSGNIDENNKVIFEETGILLEGNTSNTIDEVMDEILNIGEITGNIEEAEELVEDMREHRDSISGRVKGLDKPKVFYEIWHDPLQAAGKNSFMDNIIREAGGDNVGRLVEDIENPYPNFDVEVLIEENVDVYLSSDDGNKKVEDIRSRDGFSNIDAIRKNKIYLLEANITSRPGPRIVEALELVAECIHPEAFEMEDAS